ncbi:DDE-type integrase/transposase/recombinase, partial [Patescibacteria group bacterium]|nr:DDE-type integrase/transposase/recombinase [Patescibacteria group bacterium]
MPKTIKEERLRWIIPIYNKEMKLKEIAKVCPHSQRSLERWVSAYRKYGEAGLEPKSTRPRTNPKETPIRIKEKVIELRKETKRCALKLKWQLGKEGIIIHRNTIQKIIKKEGLVRKYRIRKLKYKYIKVPLGKGELVEIDVKYVPDFVKNKQYYQFTAIDCASRWRYLKIYNSYSNSDSIDFLQELTKIAPFRIRAIKTDNGSNFTNRYTGYLKSSDPINPRLHDLDILCQKLNIIHYLIDPGKPAQNGKVERSHRSDQETFYDRNTFKTLKELEAKIRIWNKEYNNL